MLLPTKSQNGIIETKLIEENVHEDSDNKSHEEQNKQNHNMEIELDLQDVTKFYITLLI